jgi:hypothetical protein
MIDIEWQVIAAGFLAGFDQNHTASMRNFLVVQRENGGKRSIHRVTIIGAATAIQIFAADHRRPGPQPFSPAGEFRLLVQMPVKQHWLVAFARNFDEDQWRAAFQPDHFQSCAIYRTKLRARPGFHQGDRGIHVAMRRPVPIE